MRTQKLLLDEEEYEKREGGGVTWVEYEGVEIGDQITLCTSPACRYDRREMTVIVTDVERLGGFGAWICTIRRI